MIPHLRIRTGRMELVPATLSSLRCEGKDHAELGRLLDAAIPDSWPPPLLDAETRARFIALLESGSDPLFCSWYFVRETAGERTLIGSGGTGSFSGSADVAVIGYSVLDEFQNQGYATEAVRYMLPVIFSEPSIRHVIATTYPDLPASIRVLEKSGFIPSPAPEGDGAGMEEGPLCFVAERS